MIRRTFVIAVALCVVTTLLAGWSFRVYHRDFFYLRRVHRAPALHDRERLLRIANTLDYEHPRNTAMSMMLGEALINVGEAELAERIIVVQVGLHPDDPGIRAAYADALAVQRKTRQADRVFEELLQLLRKGKSRRPKEDES